MKKTALITGSTDGIGKATAIELAKVGYTVHIHGLNAARGKKVLETLRHIDSNKEHKLFLVDLSTINSNKQFLQEYTKQHERLDLLILNALAMPKEIETTEDGIEKTFAVGFVSRYMFSLALNSLLTKGENARVIHIGEGSRAGNINYEKLKNPDYGAIKATYFSYVADGYFTYFVNKLTQIKTPHEYYHPGLVNTRQVKEIPFLIRGISKLSGLLIEPEESGELLAKHILSTTSNDVAGTYYSLGKLKKHSKKLKKTESVYRELISFSEKITGLRTEDIT